MELPEVIETSIKRVRSYDEYYLYYEDSTRTLALLFTREQLVHLASQIKGVLNGTS